MIAPYPFYGGKRRLAAQVWRRLGTPGVYVEPFAGSLAVLLHREDPCRREIVCDTNGFICLAPETRVLGCDLRYRPIGDVEVGDRLLGFDEFSETERSDGSRAPSRYRRWQPATVTGVRRARKKCFRLVLANGTEVIASEDHQWLSGGGPQSGVRSWTWASTRGLVPERGHGARRSGQVSYVLQPAPAPQDIPTPDWTWGWLGGMFDGEGHITVDPGTTLTVVQRESLTQERIERRLQEKGIDFNVERRSRPNTQTICSTRIIGSLRDRIRFLMASRPERLIDTFIDRCDRVSIYGRSHYGVALVAKEFVGEQEVVAVETDTHTFIAEGLASHNCNFWRALRADPLGVAWWADYPTVHQDLTARHVWLLEWANKEGVRLIGDATYYDTQVAGWWVWGISNWIGGEWCILDAGQRDKRPRAGERSDVGVSAQRDSMPKVGDNAGGQGVQAQRDRIPRVNDNAGGVGSNIHRTDLGQWEQCSFVGGQGVQVNRPEFSPLDGMPNGQRLLDWFYALAGRLARVIVLNRSWESAVTPTLLQHTPTGPKPTVGIFLDPPYLTHDRKRGMYKSDRGEDPDKAARESYEWAVANGERFRIAYCAHSEDFEVPPGWTFIKGTMGGINLKERRSRREAVLFSPACVGASDQLDLFAEGA